MVRVFAVAALLALALLAALAPQPSSVYACHPIIFDDPSSEVGHHGCGPPKPTPGPTASGVDRARFDLAARLGIDPSAIAVVSVEAVTWPDSSLGCPQPGMAYLQVLTPGQKIVLSAAEGTYTYHTAEAGQLVLCTSAPPPAPEPAADAAADEPAAADPADDEPTGDEPAPNDPAEDEPASEDAADDEPACEDAADDEPASEDAPVESSWLHENLTLPLARV